MRRTRTKGDAHESVTCHYSTTSCSGPVTGLATFPQAEGLDFSVIHDEVNVVRKFKNVKHCHVFWPSIDHGCGVTGVSPTRYRWPMSAYRAYCPTYTNSEIVAMIKDQNPNFSRYAFKEITDIIPTVFDAASFIREAGEIAEIGEWNVRNALNEWRRYTSKDLAGDHLAYSFGVAPLVNDLKKTRGYIAEIRKLLINLLKYEGEPQKGYYSDKGEFDLPKRATTGTVEGQVKWWRTATANYRYYLDISLDPRSMLHQAAVLLNALGFADTRNFIWNAIPFSFVLDWLTNAGDFFTQFDKDTIPYHVVIEDYCESIKFGAVQQHYLELYGDPIVRIGTRVAHYYERFNAVPDTSDIELVWDPNLNWKKIALGASLIRNLI